jgi:TRAP-type mannitol/chloroaromatic compound transport system permease small subunit
MEVSQFTMAAYYLLGGGYSMMLKGHVRMDLLYGRWSEKKRAKVDTVTDLFLIFYMVFLLYGAYSSIEYAVMYGQRNRSAWAPYMAPIKIIMGIGVSADAAAGRRNVFQGLAKARGRRYNMSYELIAILIFTSMMLMLLTGQRVFAAIGGVATLVCTAVVGQGGCRDAF